MTNEQYNKMVSRLNKITWVSDLIVDLMFWNAEPGERLFYMSKLKVKNHGRTHCIVVSFETCSTEPDELKIDWPEHPVVLRFLFPKEKT